MTFALEYNSALLRGMVTDKKVLDEAFVVVDLIGESPRDLHATISSPNYPQNYPNAANFCYLIKTTKGHKIRFSLINLDLESCCDSLMVYDGKTTSSPIIGFISGQLPTRKWVFETNDNALLVVLKTDC